MTTFAITVTLSDKEIWALVQALEHHAAVHYEWLLKKFGGRERSIDGILHLCSVILRLRELTVYSPMDPMVFSDDEVRMVGKAIDDYKPCASGKEATSAWRANAPMASSRPCLRRSCLASNMLMAAGRRRAGLFLAMKPRESQARFGSRNDHWLVGGFRLHHEREDLPSSKAAAAGL